MFETFRRTMLESIEKKGRAEGSPIVNFRGREISVEKVISVEGEDIYVGQKPLEMLFLVSAFYLALPPYTYGVVVYPDGTVYELEEKLYEVPAGVYRIHYVDKRELTDLLDPISEITTDGEKLMLLTMLRYRVKNPVAVLEILRPVETLIEYAEADVAQYIRTHKYGEIAEAAENANSKLFSFLSDRHNRRKPLSDAIEITGIEFREFSRHVSPVIFISYRRIDSADIAGRVYDRLVERFGKAVIFKDVDSIPLGFDFRDYIKKKVSECNIFLAIIGDKWLEVSDSAGKNRLNNPDDLVRFEIESVLARNILLIPLFVREAVMPAEEKLPESLRKLVYRNGQKVRHDPDFHRDMDRLISSLEKFF